MKSEIKQLKKIKVISLAKIFAVIGIIVGFLFGIMSAIQASANPMTFSQAMQYVQTSPDQVVSLFFLALGYWSIIVAPILFGIAQFIYGAIVALIYNLIAKYVGGVKVVLE
ncbi:hypothetical protein KA107_01780 [Candidatus Pacearchaeota archaeon]|nr:hypothetical protein [Candidatus Pacearchaeota archaeon]